MDRKFRRLENKITRLECEIRSLFHKYQVLTFSDLKYFLQQEPEVFSKEELLRYTLEDKEVSFNQKKYLWPLEEQKITDEEINYCLQHLFVIKMELKRNDYWQKETEYELLNRDLQGASATRRFFSFKVDDYENKSFLLISDTHIGKEEIEDFELIHNVYEYAVQKGAKVCFHLGDLFAGNFDGNRLTHDKGYRQIDSFLKNYPDSKQIKTYALLGNHDEHLNKVYQEDYDVPYFDLRGLTLEKPNFYVFPRNQWCSEFSNITINFSHPFFLSYLVKDYRLTDLDTLKEMEWVLDDIHNVQISGHLHCGLIYSVNNPTEIHNEKIFLGVPSTSRFNLNKTVAYLVNLNYQSKETIENMEVIPLNSDTDGKISEGDIIHWSFSHPNKVYRKSF